MRYSISIIFKIIFVSLFVFNISLAESVARLIKAEGVVKIKRFGMQTYNEIAQVGGSINNGDAIKVGDYGYAALIFIDELLIEYVILLPSASVAVTVPIEVSFSSMLNEELDVITGALSFTFKIEIVTSVSYTHLTLPTIE